MPTLHALETKEKDRPIILLCGNKSSLLTSLIAFYLENFKIVLVSPETLQTSTDDPNFYRIHPSSLYLADKLVEKIDYAVIFLSSVADRQYLLLTQEKFKADHTKVVILVDIKKLPELYDLILDLKKNLLPSVLFYEEIFGGRDSNQPKFIDSAIRNKTITLSGNGLFPYFCISEKDAITGINHILLGRSKQGNFFYLFYNHPLTVISATHLLKRVEPELAINFEEKENTESYISFDKLNRTIQEKLLEKPEFLDRYLDGFEKGIKDIFESPQESYSYEKKDVSLISKMRKASAITMKVNRKKGIAGIIFTSFFLFIIINIALIVAAIVLAKQSINEFEKDNISRGFSYIKASNIFFHLSSPFYTPATHIFSVITSNNDVEKQLIFLKQIINTSSSFPIHANQAIYKNGIERLDLENMLSLLTFLYLKGEELKSGKNNPFGKIITSQNAKLITLFPVLPSVLGYNGPKNYLVLFQNNGELRPTGGFIGSVGEITMDSGKITKIKIRDVYELDGQLKAHIEPHFIIRRYLQPHLYLRDSNFDPDFEKTASFSALLYNAESGKKVDGVVAIDFEVLKRVIKSIGPLYLPDYKKTLDENSTFDFLQDTIKEGFFPGSTQKKDVLQALFNQIILKLDQNPASLIKLLSLLPSLLEEKHVLFAFPDVQTQNIFSANGFSSNYRDLRSKEENEILDTLSINEANIGVNKANIHLTRSVDYDVFLDKAGEIESKTTITFKNANLKDVYKAYIRFLVPQGSTLLSVKIDGKEQTLNPAITDYKVYESKDFKPPTALEIENSQENGMQIFGFIANVPENSDQKIEVRYKNGISPQTSSLYTYSLLYFKQPGADTYPVRLNIHYKNGYSPQEVVNASFDNNTIVLADTIQKDKEFKLKLLKAQ